MGTPWRIVRVFISSTFRDMQAERDHLVRFVFPRLREALLKRRILLVDVDLRWGVTSEQDALEVCREIIDECRPRFLCMLGGRYGWTPPGQERSITAAEIRYAVLDRPDEKRYCFFYFRHPAVTESIPDADARAGGCREFSRAEEIAQYGEARAEAIAAERGEKLEATKRAIVDAGFRPFLYSPQWDPREHRLVGLDAFGERVAEDVLGSVNDEFGQEPISAPDEFADQNAAMDAFVEERVRHYVVGTRQPILGRLRRHAEDAGGNGYLCLVGEPGSGKSALLARFYRDYVGPAERPAHAGHLVIPHFVGGSVRSSEVRQLLRRLCHELAAGAGLREEIPDSYDALLQAFPAFLTRASAAKHVVLLIDAVNQLEPSQEPSVVRWLPDTLPENARVILSAAPSPAWEELRARPAPPVEVRLPALDWADASAIVREFLRLYRKRLEPDQLTALIRKTERGGRLVPGAPLYLLAALEELRTLGSPDVAGRIRDLPEETTAMFVWILRRLEQDPGFRDRDGTPIGSDLVRQFVSYLGASRHGLAPRELAELIAPGDMRQIPPIPRDPHGHVAALQRLLRPYLMYRGDLLDFYHSEFRGAVMGVYLHGEEQLRDRHRQLADYFQTQALSPRKAEELPWQLSKAEEWSRLRDALADVPLLAAAWGRDNEEVVAHWAEVVRHLGCRVSDVYAPRWETALRDGHPVGPIAQILGTMGFPEESERITSAMVEYCRRRPDQKRSLARALSAWSQFLHARNDLDGARRLLEESARICRELGDDFGLSNCLSDLAGCVVGQNPHEALRLLREAEAIERRAGRAFSLATIAGNQANVFKHLGQLDRAVELQGEAVRLCEEWGMQIAAAEHRAGLALCLRRLGDWEEALRLLGSAEQAFRHFNQFGDLGSCLGNQANILAEHGRPEEAFQKNSEVEALLRRSGQLVWLIQCLQNQAALCLATGRQRLGEQKAREALERMIDHRAPPPIQLQCAQLLSQLDPEAGRGRSLRCRQCGGTCVRVRQGAFCVRCGAFTQTGP